MQLARQSDASENLQRDDYSTFSGNAQLSDFFISQNKMANKIHNLAISQKYIASRLLDINDYSTLSGKEGQMSRGILGQIMQTRAHANDSQMRVGVRNRQRGVVLEFLPRRQQWLGRSMNNRTRSMNKLASLNARLIIDSEDSVS